VQLASHRPSFLPVARRLVLVACLIAGLLSFSAGPAMAMPHAKRAAKACKKVARTSSPARPTPLRATHKRAAVRRAKRNAMRCVRVVRRRIVAPWSTTRRPSAPAGHGSSQTGSPSSPAAPAAGTPEPEPDMAAPLPPSNPSAIQVLSGEFFLQLSKPEVHAGNVRVEFNNRTAEDPHDLHLFRSDGTGANYAFGELEPGEVEAKTLTLNTGTWRLLCALPEHAELGMSAKLRVVAG
jgi:hypothetical protein